MIRAVRVSLSARGNTVIMTCSAGRTRMFRIQSVFWPQNRADDSLAGFRVVPQDHGGGGAALAGLPSGVHQYQECVAQEPAPSPVIQRQRQSEDYEGEPTRLPANPAERRINGRTCTIFKAGGETCHDTIGRWFSRPASDTTASLAGREMPRARLECWSTAGRGGHGQQAHRERVRPGCEEAEAHGVAQGSGLSEAGSRVFLPGRLW